MKIRCVIYDFDGVICDSVNVKTEAFAQMYQRYGSDIVEEVVKYHRANGGISRFDKFRYFANELLGKSISDKDVTDMGDMFSSLVMQKVIDAEYLPGAKDFIKISSTKFLQFICTGTPESEMRQIVHAKGLMPFFKEIFGTPQSKENIITNILQKYRLHPLEVLFIGDAMTDYRAAANTGVRFIGIVNENTEFPKGTQLITDFTDPGLQDIVKSEEI